MVFQQFNLFPHLTVLQNVTIAQRRVLKRRKREAEDGRRGRTWSRSASATRPTPTPPSSPAASSSGWPSPGRWRWTPTLMLFDEPTSALDPELVGDVLGGHAQAGRGGHDDDGGHPRDGLRPRGRPTAWSSWTAA